MDIENNILNHNSRKHIYFFLDSLKMKNNKKINENIEYLFSLEKLELKNVIMFKYYINYIIVYGDSGNLKKIYDRLLKLTQYEKNNKYKDYIFALLYYIIIEQKLLIKNNTKPVFNKEAINNLFKKYVL